MPVQDSIPEKEKNKKNLTRFNPIIDCYSREGLEKRNEFLAKELKVNLNPLLDFQVDPSNFKGNIENPIGVAQIPVGVVGPLKVDGDFAKGTFYVPMATTEGVLTSSFNIGMRVITKSGGVSVKLLKDELHVSSLFIIQDLQKSLDFINWVQNNYSLIKEVANATTKHGQLNSIESMLSGNGVILRFIYDTKDAMGMNMINLATDKACQYISEATGIDDFCARSNFSSDKKTSMFNLHKGYGKELFASAVITKTALRLLRVTPEEIYKFYCRALASSARAGMIGFNGQVANGVASIFLACGQDIAHVLHASHGTSSITLTKDNNLYISIHIPNLLVGTVGGGTALPTQKACLEIMDCYGNGKAKKLAEIIAAAVLAGELAICAALTNGTFFEAHEKMGRNKPFNEEK